MDIVPTFAVATSGEEDGAAVPPVSQQHPGIEQEDQKKLLHDGNALKSCISIAQACLSLLQRLKPLSRVRGSCRTKKYRPSSQNTTTTSRRASRTRCRACRGYQEGPRPFSGGDLAVIGPLLGAEEWREEKATLHKPLRPHRKR